MKILYELKMDLLANSPSDMKFSSFYYRLFWSLFFSQGFQLCILYRFYCYLNSKSWVARFFAKIFFNFSTILFSCHVHPAAKIGAGAEFPHPTGIVIGRTSVIGKNTKIYQNVTIGVENSKGSVFPNIGDGVIIYSGAVLIGGISIGDLAIVGANSVVLCDVPANAVAVGVPARIINKSV